LSRSVRIVQSLGLGFGFQLVVLVVGFWLTPFLLHRLGQAPLGQWLILSQVLSYLGLLDLGVVAVLSRDVSIAHGSPNRTELLGDILRRTSRVLLMQLPFIALVALAVWFGISSRDPALELPLGIVAASFAFVFPFRASAAILTGFQDLAFLGLMQMLSWAITTGISVVMVTSGFGLVSLAVGYAVGQLFQVTVSTVRLFRREPGLSRELFRRGEGAGFWRSLRPSLWVSLQQVSHLLSNGTDFIVLGAILGPEAVVIYSCTIRLATICNQFPYQLAVVSQPSIGELRGQNDRERLLDAIESLNGVLLILSGGIAIGLMVFNEWFVIRWVGPEQYGGFDLLVCYLFVMVVRHLAFSWTHQLFVFGWERGIAIVSSLDAVLIVAFAAVGCSLFGPVGVPMGSGLAVLVTQVPFGLIGLSRELGQPVSRILSQLMPFLSRFLFLAALSFHAVKTWPLSGSFWGTAGATLLFGALYLAVMFPLLRREPVRSKVDFLWARVRARFV
jgi:O-antigen/teichoic acid export membrane protein